MMIIRHMRRCLALLIRPLLGPAHQAASGKLDTVMGIDDDGAGFRSGHAGQGRPAKIRESRRVDEVYVNAIVIEAGDRGIEGMVILVLERVVVRHGVAAFYGSGFANGAGSGQQCFDQRGFAATGVAYQRDVADVLGTIIGHSKILS
jgi:hypothetical protein